MSSPIVTAALGQTQALASLVERWIANVDEMQTIAVSRGFTVMNSWRAKPAAETALTNAEIARGPFPQQLRWVIATVAEEWQFGWRCANDDKPSGTIAAFDFGGVRNKLWSLEHIVEYADANFQNWKKLCVKEAESEHRYEEANPASMWDNQFAFFDLVNGDMLTIDVSSEDPQQQPVRYFSHEIEGLHGREIAPDFFTFLSVWTELGCVGGEQQTWLSLTPTISERKAPLSSTCVNAEIWKQWLRSALAQRGSDEPPPSVVAKSPADFALLAAAERNSVEGVEAAIAAGANLDACAEKGYRVESLTALHHAVDANNVTLIQLLIDRGATLDTQKLLLLHAAWQGKTETILWLIEHGARIDPWKHDQKSTLHVLIDRLNQNKISNPEFILLLEASIAKKCNVDCFATAQSSAASTTLLMRLGPSKQGLLLAAGANPSLRDEQGKTAMHHAWFKESVVLLKSAGLDVNDLSTPREGEFATRPLQTALAEWNSNVDRVKMFLDEGADPTLPDSEAQSAWWHCNSAGGARLLAAYGFSVNEKNSKGQGLLHRAIEWSKRLSDQQIGLLAYWCELGLDTNMRDADGNTGLHVAATHASSEHDVTSMKAILCAGADKTLINHAKQAAWQCLKRSLQAGQLGNLLKVR
jgi:ankyrin repeat protein